MKKFIYMMGLLGASLAFTQCSSEQTKSAEFKGEPIAVQVNKTASAENNGKTLSSGRVVAKHSVNLSTRMMGYISALPVEVGEAVQAGQQLVALNNADIDAQSGQVMAQINQAQAQYENAKKDYERFKNLFDSESASQKELDDMTTRYKMAEANLEAAKQMKNEVGAHKNYTNITAPISGIVTAKFVNKGDLANPGMPLLTIESPDELQVQVLVSERNINQVEKEMEVKVMLPKGDAETTGKVAEVSRSAANTGGQYMVKINLENGTDLLPGMFLRVQFPFQPHGREAQGVLISETALVRNGQLQGVYVVSDQNTAVLRWLKMGRQFGDQVEVLAGLGNEETYILQADGRLFNGAPVKVN